MDDSAPDGSKRSVNERIDIRVGVDRRRRWGPEDKLRIVRESLAPNVVVTEVARRHEISTGLLYTWRKQALAGLLPWARRNGAVILAARSPRADRAAAVTDRPIALSRLAIDALVFALRGGCDRHGDSFQLTSISHRCFGPSLCAAGRRLLG